MPVLLIAAAAFGGGVYLGSEMNAWLKWGLIGGAAYVAYRVVK